MENFRLREQLDKSPYRIGFRPPESLEALRKTAIILTREIAANYPKAPDPIKDSPELKTAYCDLIAILLELESCDQLEESPEYYKYKRQ